MQLIKPVLKICFTQWNMQKLIFLNKRTNLGELAVMTLDIFCF